MNQVPYQSRNQHHLAHILLVDSIPVRPPILQHVRGLRISLSAVRKIFNKNMDAKKDAKYDEGEKMVWTKTIKY